MKKNLMKAGILLVVFLTALFVISGIMNKGNTDMTVEMAKATFPIVTMRYGDRDINQLHGYAEAMEVNHMRDSITPLAEGRKVTVRVDGYGREIAGLAFEVRSVDGNRLIESTKVEEYTIIESTGSDQEKTEQTIEATFGLKDLIENDKEYMLVIFVTTGDGKEIRYYTRVVASEEYYAGEKLDYVVDFSDRTFDKERAKELTKYLESNAEGDNTTFGRVTIHSSFSQVTWGDLAVRRINDPLITIKELASQTGSFLLQYDVAVENGEKESYYAVKEFFRVRYTSERIYLLDYERTMNQIFDEKGDIFANNKIFLGIMGDEVPLMESDGGNVVAFVVENRLYSYNVVDHKLAFLFGFYNQENLDARTLYDKHAIKILNVDEAGNVTFMVYGYMNRGRHEGQTGVSVYYYNSTVNTTEEMVYVPYYQSPELLLAEVEKLSYINRTGTLYLMFGNEIYGINALNRSSEVVVSNLKEGSYQVSDSNLMVAWQQGEELYQGKELILFNLNTGKKTSIQAGNGESITPIGFMGEDLIYGIARDSDMVSDSTGNTVYPMYCVKIQNEDEGVLKEYRLENVYITEGRVEGNQIILKRAQKDENGEYTEIEDDHIMNAEEEQEALNSIQTVAVDTFEKVTQIALKDEVPKSAVKILTPREVLFEGGRNTVLTEAETEFERYYVYGKNGIEDIFMDEGNAVTLAYDISGVVINDDGAYVWMRGNRSLKNQIMAIKGETMTEEKSSLAVCLDTMLAYEGISRNSQYLLEQGKNVFTILQESLDEVQVLDLSGCSLDAVLYYVNQDIPVLVMLEDGSAVLLIGFNEMNTVVMNPETGTVYKVGMNDSREWFEENGNRFITYVRKDS